MSGTGTPNLDLQYLDPSQAQPEVKINDAWDKIDEAVGLASGTSVSDTTTSPPIVIAAREIKFDGATVSRLTDNIALVQISGGGGSGGGGSPVEVTDGTTTVTDVTELHITSGGVVTSGGAGIAQLAIAGGGGGGAVATFVNGAINVDSHPKNPGTLDDEFESASLDPAWSLLNWGTTTAVTENGELIMTGRMDSGQGPSTGARNVSMITKPFAAGAGNFKIRAKFNQDITYTPSDSGIALYESSSGKIVTLGMYNSTGTMEVIAVSWASTSVLNAVISSGTGIFSTSQWWQTKWSPTAYWEIENISGTLHFRVSLTGEEGTFIEISTATLSTYFTTAPDRAGLYTESYNQSGPAVLRCDWIRDLTNGYTPQISGAVTTFLNATISPDSHPQNSTPVDDEFEYGTAIDTTGARGGSAWTLFESGAAELVSAGSLIISPPTSGSKRIYGWTQPIAAPGSPWEYVCKVKQLNPNVSNTLGGLFIATSAGTSGPNILFGVAGTILYVQRNTDNSTFSSNEFSLATSLAPQESLTQYGGCYLRIRFDGTNLNYEASASGFDGTWISVGAETPGAFLGTAAMVGLGGGVYGTQYSLIFDWFRNYSGGYIPAIGAVGGGGNVTPDTHPSAPNALNDEFESGTLDPKWSWLNQAAGSAAFANGSIKLQSDTGTSINKQCLVQPISGSAWKIRTKMSAILVSSTNNSGLIMYESATGKNVVWAVYWNGSSLHLYAAYYTSLTSASGATSIYAADITGQLGYSFTNTEWLYYEVELISGTLHFRVSTTGIEGTYYDVTTEALSTPFTTAPDNVGIFAESQSASQFAVGIFDWFRRVS